MYNSEDIVTVIGELAQINRFFNFIANIHDKGHISAADYVERLGIMQELLPYKDRLKVKKDIKGRTHAYFDAEANISGIAPYLLKDTAPSLMFSVESCKNGHAAYTEPAKNLLFTTESLIRTPEKMENIVIDAIENFTSDFAMPDCNVQGCDALRARNFVYSGK